MSLRETSVSALEYDRGGSCAVLSLVGQAGIGDRVWFRRLLELSAEQGKHRVIVDLSRLSSMDWWVALMLLWAGRVVSRRGVVLVLACPQPAVARLLEAAGATAELAVYDTVRQARNAAPEESRPYRDGSARATAM